MPKQPSILNALPAYQGGKRRLSSLIFATLQDVVPRDAWTSLEVLDPFCGGGAVALAAKSLGFRIVASDLATRSAIVARALIANSTTRLSQHDLARLIHHLRACGTAIEIPDGLEGYTRTQARWLVGAFDFAATLSEPKRSLIQLVTIKQMLRMQPMSVTNATDARAAAADDFDRISPVRTRHYLRGRGLLTSAETWRVAQEVNAGVFGGRGAACQGDALDMIANTATDVVYLDPPYAGTSGYSTIYRAIDRLIGDDLTAARVPSLDDLLAVSQHIPTLVLSYGGPTVTLESLTEQVERYRKVRHALAIPYAHLRSLAREEKNRANREFIIVATR